MTEAVMGGFAALVHDCRRADALIAATAVEHGLAVVTQDAGFRAMAAAHPALVVEEV